MRCRAGAAGRDEVAHRRGKEHKRALWLRFVRTRAAKNMPDSIGRMAFGNAYTAAGMVTA